MSDDKSKKGTEVFSIGPDGKKTDAPWHDEILDQPEADKANADEYIQRLRAQGASPDRIARAMRNNAAYANAVRRAGTTNNNPAPTAMARGGVGSAPWNVRRSSHPQGMIKSSIPGRTDKIPMNLPPGSYILPADIPSALGEGNTMAGERILGKMFKIGPYGSGATGAVQASRPQRPLQQRLNLSRRRFAEGGETDQVPIIAAGGEYVIHPETVMEVGHGDMDAGHRVLDKFVLTVRKKHIDTLKKLKPPKK